MNEPKKLRLEAIYEDWVEPEESEEDPDLECPGPDRDPPFLWCG